MAVLALAVVAGGVAGTVRALAGSPAVTSADEDHPGAVLLVPGYGGSTTALDQLAGKIAAVGGRAIVVKLAGDGTPAGDRPGHPPAVAVPVDHR